MRKYFSFYLFIICLCATHIPTYGQIGINTESAFEYAELDVQNAKKSDGEAIPKGILIPRLTDKLQDEIDTSIEGSDGLLLYNVDNDCFSYFSKEQNKWLDICGQDAKAIFDPINCASITTNGAYVQDVTMNSANTLSIKTNVIKTGIFELILTTGNGYSFQVSGSALATGELIITVPALGVPKKAGTDDLTITGITFSDDKCKPQIVVQPAYSYYSIDCGNLSVKGRYYKNTKLDATNYIELVVNVSQVGSYYIRSEEVNGVSFAGRGVFTKKGMNTVKIPGSGTPTVNEDFEVVLNTNSPVGASSCTATVPIILPAMTYGIVGNSIYSWDSTIRKRALSDKATFSPDGVIKMIEFTMLWNTSNGSTAANWLKNGDANGKFPDVVLFFAYGASNNKVLGPQLAAYIKEGGCVIYGTEDGKVDDANAILGGVFGSDYNNMAVAQIAGSYNNDNVYPVLEDQNDAIVNGPFGNASGTWWGEDNFSNGSVIVTQLPPNSVQVATAYNSFGKPTVNPEYSIVWYNDSYNFVYFGDSVAPTTSGGGGSTRSYPAYYPNYSPASKLYGYPSARFVNNSILELNAVAWCIKKAAVSGINPH